MRAWASFGSAFFSGGRNNNDLVGTADSNGNVNVLYTGFAILWGLAVDSDGAAYINAYNPGIIKVTLDGTAAVVAGTRAIGTDSIAIDSHGALYTVGSDGIIRKTAGGISTTVAGGTDQTSLATEAPLTAPTGIAVLPGGDLVVADNTGDASSGMFGIRRIAPNGQWHFINSPVAVSGVLPSWAVVVQGGNLHALVQGSPYSNPSWKIIKFNANDSSEIEITTRPNVISEAYGLAADGKGNYYIAGVADDYRSRAIWKLGSDGILQKVLDLTTDYMEPGRIYAQTTLATSTSPTAREC